MTSRNRLVQFVVVVALAFVTRWLHIEFRAAGVADGSVAWYLVLGVLYALVALVMDSPPRTTKTSTVFVSALAASLVGMGLAATMQLFFPDTLPRFSLLAMTGLTFVWLFVSGCTMAWNARRTGQADRVVAVASLSDADALMREGAAAKLEMPFSVVACISDPAHYDEVAERCTTMAATVLVLGAEAIIAPAVIQQAESLHRDGLRVRSLDDFYDERLGKLPVSSLDSFALLGDIESLHGGYAPLKRVIDLLLAGAGAIVLLVLMPIVLIGNLIGNRGPLLFRQQRVGLFGEPFDIIKLRTMVPGAVDVSGWTSNNDPRITSFGKLMRRTHIDELPQVFNIFVGDLSVVGPRPEQVGYARDLEKSLPFYAARHLVHPGLTGWAQVRYRYAASEEDAYVKLQYDLYYVRHESFSTDLRIIWLTLRHLVVDGGR